jgi:anti-anti-sigma factor
MALSHRNYAKVRVVAPVGRLDHDNCEAFRSDLAPHLDACLREGHALIFDLSRLEYVSSAGLRCLMLAARQAVSRSGRLVIASLQPLVAEIFQISRFNLVFDVFPTMREALASVSSEAVEAFERG